MPAAPARSISLKSPHHRKSLFIKNNRLKKKKRPSTWTCHNNHTHKYRYTVSPRVSRWVSQHNQNHNSSKRQTMATISTLTTNTYSATTTLDNNSHVYWNNEQQPPSADIFHPQSLLFLLGFLFFPCWWIGGYYLKVNREPRTSRDIEKTMTVHPSLLANGRTSSRLLWLSTTEGPLLDDTYHLFYKWNRCMSLVSIGLTLFIVSLIVWYFVEYHHY